MRSGRVRAFTLIELMVVLAILATLLTLALPKYLHSVERSREVVLRHDLRALRGAIDQFKADRGRYPATLDELAEQRYLHTIPRDPITDSATTWVTVPPPEGAGDGVYDVHSGAAGAGLDGTPFDGW